MNDKKKVDLKIPKYLNEWCTSNLPATSSIEIRPGSTSFYAVCDNCYYDYVYGGVYTYSWNDSKRSGPKRRGVSYIMSIDSSYKVK